MAQKSDTASFVGPIRTRLFALTIFLLVASLLAISYDALQKFEDDLVPETERKAAVVGKSLVTEIDRALNYGIPLKVLGGMEIFLQTTLKSHSEIRYIAITNAGGQVLFSVGAVTPELKTYYRKSLIGHSLALGNKSVSIGDFLDNAFSIQANERSVGTLHVGIDKKFVQKKLEDIIFDVLIVLLVALLITFELLLFLVSTNVSRPIERLHQLMLQVEIGDFRKTLAHRSRDEVGRFIATLTSLIGQVNEHFQQITERAEALRKEPDNKQDNTKKRVIAHIGEMMNRVHTAPQGKPEVTRESTLVDVRTPMFLFILAEELSRSFMPLYITELYVPVPGLSPELVIGLPISIFMLFVAIATPFAGMWTDRFGSRRLFLTGAVLAIGGFLGTAFAYNLYDLLVWRSITAIAYALITMSCQGFIVSITTKKNRAQGMAVFIGAIMVAAICGTSIGGVLADRLGYRATFFMSAALAGLSAVFVYNVFSRGRNSTTASRPSLRFQDFISLFGNARFSVLMVFGAIPAKLILTGFLFYLTPLYLFELDNSQSEIGRGMMLYFILMVFGTPVFARLSDKYGRQIIPVVIGGFLAGGGALAMIQFDNSLGVLLGIGGLGLGHAMATAPLISLVPVVCAEQVRTLGQTTVLSIFRIVERTGSVAGPFAAATLIGVYGFSDAIIILGVVVLGCTLILTGFFLVAGNSRKPSEART